MILRTLARRAGVVGLGVAITGLWLGLAAWAHYAPTSLSYAFLGIGGICGGLTAALAVLGVLGPAVRHTGDRARPRRPWPSWAPARTADRPTAALDGHVVPPSHASLYSIPLAELPEAEPAGPPWGPAPRPATPRPRSWGPYPNPHTDEDDTCQCPDHRAGRALRSFGL